MLPDRNPENKRKRTSEVLKPFEFTKCPESRLGEELQSFMKSIVSDLHAEMRQILGPPQTQPRSQGLSSLPPLVVGIKTLVAAGHVTTYYTNYSTGDESMNNFVALKWSEIKSIAGHRHTGKHTFGVVQSYSKLHTGQTNYHDLHISSVLK